MKCAEKFRFLWKFDEMSNAELLACTEALQKSYPNDISEDIINEVALLKQGFQANFNCVPKRATPQILMRGIIDSNLRNIFPNNFVAARIFLAIPPTVATGERGFSTLKYIKNTLRSTIRKTD